MRAERCARVQTSIRDEKNGMWRGRVGWLAVELWDIRWLECRDGSLSMLDLWVGPWECALARGRVMRLHVLAEGVAGWLAGWLAGRL